MTLLLASTSLKKPMYIAVGRLPGLHRQHRLLRLGRQLVAHRVDLGVDLGQRAVGVVVEPQRRGDGRHARCCWSTRGSRCLAPARSPLSSGWVMKPATVCGVGAVIRRADGDDGVLGLRILADGQACERAQAEHEDQQAEDVASTGLRMKRSVKFMRLRLTVPAASGFGLFAGCTLLSIARRAVLQLDLAAGHDLGARLEPLRIATWSPRVGPVVTNTCCAIEQRIALVVLLVRRLHDEHRVAVRVVGDGGLRQRQIALLAARIDLDAGEHAGSS